MIFSIFISHCLQGLYRISGVQSKIQSLFITTLEKGKPWNADDEDEITITGAVKLAFKTLIEPLFTFALYDDLIEAACGLEMLLSMVLMSAVMKDEGQKILKLRGALAQLPTGNFQTAEVLFSHLRRYVIYCFLFSNNMINDGIFDDD